MGLFGENADRVSKRLIDLGDEQARLTGIDDDTIRLTQSKLLTFKELAQPADVLGGAFDRATMAAIDMAGAGFGSAETNAVQLGKALNDPVKGITALARSGITFTAQEREKIAVLVKSNQTLKAQDMILKAIEKQVGGAAIATSTASGRMKQSWEQLKEEFGKPFSVGLGNALTSIATQMPTYAAKFAEFGSLIGKTIYESVSGDSTRLIMIGSLIGDLIKEGLKLSLRGMTDIAGQFYLDTLESQKYNPLGAVSRKFGGAEKHRLGAEYGMQNALGQASRSITEKYNDALSMENRGAVPHAPGYRYAQPNEAATMMDGERVVRILDSIDRKLSPQP
jgi:hypothetical protein